MNNSVTLVFEKSLNSLAGYDFGQRVYHEQAEGILDISKEYTVIFPDAIEMVAASFAQGFFSSIIEQIGLSKMEKRTVIKCSSKFLADNIKKKALQGLNY